MRSEAYFRKVLADPVLFAEYFLGVKLRAHEVEILRSIQKHRRTAILLNPNNPRVHSREQRTVLRDLLQQVGMADALLVSEGGEDGHSNYWMATYGASWSRECVGPSRFDRGERRISDPRHEP
jgi:hypothetical protein